MTHEKNNLPCVKYEALVFKFTILNQIKKPPNWAALQIKKAKILSVDN
jgi:hypothetical protein